MPRQDRFLRSFSCGRPPGRLLHPEGVGRANHLVGHSHRDLVVRLLARLEREDPGPELPVLHLAGSGPLCRQDGRPRPLNQQTSESAVATFGDLSQADLVSRGVLARDQSQVGGHVPPVPESGGMADDRDHRGGHNRPDPRHRLKNAARLVRTGQALHLPVEFVELFRQSPDLRLELPEKGSGRLGQRVRPVVEDLRETSLEIPDSPGPFFDF